MNVSHSNNKKVKVSKEQFAEGLFQWLSGFLTEKAVKKTAKDIGFKIRNNKDFTKIFEELFILDMWLIVHTAEGIFVDEDKRNECLDMFHHLIYNCHIESTERSYNDWMMSIAPRYAEYGKARETEHPSTPLWVGQMCLTRGYLEKSKMTCVFKRWLLFIKDCL